MDLRNSTNPSKYMEITPIHIIIKMLQTNEEEKVLKITRIKEIMTMTAEIYKIENKQ